MPRTRKQTRRSISVSKGTYDKIKAHVDPTGGSLSGFIEDLIACANLPDPPPRSETGPEVLTEPSPVPKAKLLTEPAPAPTGPKLIEFKVETRPGGPKTAAQIRKDLEPEVVLKKAPLRDAPIPMPLPEGKIFTF